MPSILIAALRVAIPSRFWENARVWPATRDYMLSKVDNIWPNINEQLEIENACFLGEEDLGE